MKPIFNKIKYPLSIIFTIGLLTSCIAYYFWYKDSKSIDEQIKNINKVVNIQKVPLNTNETPLNPDSPYTKYPTLSMIDVDLNSLKEINPETKGWIEVLGTNINYPFVQHSDNNFYLNHSFDKNSNRAGWVFLDSRNDIETLDRNNIIYAHGRINTVLFGTLKNILKSNWYSNTKYHIVRMSTESHNTLWEVFSVYQIPVTSDYIVTDFSNDQSYEYFLKYLIERSEYEFNVELNKDDKILTLSTCTSPSTRVVMHARLINLENK